LYFLREALIVPALIRVLGESKTETILVGNGVSFGGPKLADMTISGGRLGWFDIGVQQGPIVVERVAVHAHVAPGTIDNIAFGSDAALLTISDSEFVATGGQRAFGIYVPLGTYHVVRTRIQALGDQHAEGIRQSSDDGGLLTVEDSSVQASARDVVFGVVCNAEGGHCDIIRSNVTGSVLVASGVTLGLVDSHVIGNVGGVGDSGTDFIVDGAMIEGGVSPSPGFGGNVSIRRSQFSGFGFTNDGGGAHIELDSTIVRNGVWVESVDPGQFTATSSILGGTRTFTNVTASCTKVYDENGSPLGANCQR
jgi:hypothetical protein